MKRKIVLEPVHIGYQLIDKLPVTALCNLEKWLDQWLFSHETREMIRNKVANAFANGDSHICFDPPLRGVASNMHKAFEKPSWVYAF